MKIIFKVGPPGPPFLQVQGIYTNKKQPSDRDGQSLLKKKEKKQRKQKYTLLFYFAFFYFYLLSFIFSYK